MISVAGKSGFRGFPISLKLVVTWLGLAALFDLLLFVRTGRDGVAFLFYGIVHLILVIGLLQKRYAAWFFTSLWLSLAILMRLVLLASIALGSEFTPVPTGLGLQFGSVYLALSKSRIIALMISNLVLNAGAICLLRLRGIQAIFVPPTTKSKAS